MDKLLKVCFSSQISTRRSISCSGVARGRRNFRKFVLPNRGSEEFRKKQEEDPHPDIFPVRFGVRNTTIRIAGGKKKVEIPEMIPEIIVPDLTGFPLKPYVSYKAIEVYQSEFTAKDLFNVFYKKKIESDFETNKLDENGNPLEPSPAEELTPEQARNLARRTGTDLFAEELKPREEQ